MKSPVNEPAKSGTHPNRVSNESAVVKAGKSGSSSKKSSIGTKM